MSHVLYRLGRFAARRPWVVIGAWLLAAVVVIGSSSAFGRTLDESVEVPGLDSQQALVLLSKAGADSAGLTAYVVARPRAEGVTFSDASDGGAAARDGLVRLRSEIAALPNVLATTDPAGALAAGRDDAVRSGAVSADGRVALLRVQYPVRTELTAADLERLEAAVAGVRSSSDLQIESGGDLSFAFAQPTTGIGEVVGLVAAVVILLLAFGSVVAMGLPIGMAVLGLAISLSSMALLMYLVDIPSWAAQIGTMVGLGVGIDYALFLVTRHRELLARGMTVEEAAGRAVATAGQAVVFAGGTVVIAILGLAVTGIPFVTFGGVAIALIVLTMVIASITLLPAFLGLAGHRINGRRARRAAAERAAERASGHETSARAVGRSSVGDAGVAAAVGDAGGVADGDAAGRSGWERWGAHVADHALAYAVGATAVLLALAVPVLTLRLGFPDEGTLPASRTERRAYDLVAEGFGPGVNSPLVVAVATGGDEAVLTPLAAAIDADPGIAAVAPPAVDAGSGVATLLAFPTTSPQDEATLDTVDRLRTSVLPAALAGSRAEAHIGGATATWGDLGQRVQERLPAFIAAVVLLSFVLLLLVFRSILVPLKAALLNLLSIGAAYGVMVLVFQWGWGMGLIGLEATVPIIPFIPLFMFAILFGLSMDYEVFLLSRVREEYLLTGDNASSVVHGLARTARVITSAALIMIAVFVSFALGDDPSIKMFGIGLATAVLVDATIVRLVLVPATMELLGDANWWIPAWLDRLLPTIDIDGEAGLPEPELDPSSPTGSRETSSVDEVGGTPDGPGEEDRRLARSGAR